MPESMPETGETVRVRLGLERVLYVAGELDRGAASVEVEATLTGRDALVYRVGLAAVAIRDTRDAYTQNRSGANSKRQYDALDAYDDTLAALSAFDAAQEGDKDGK